MNEKDPCWPCDQDVIDKLPPCPLQCRTEKCKAFKRSSFEGKPIVWVVGPPCSGKTTQCGKIAAKYGLKLLVAEDLLNEEVKSGSVRGKCLSKVMERNETAPTDVIVDLLKAAIYNNLETSKGFLIDGFPKEKSQGVMFEKRIVPSTVIFYLEASTDTLARRLMARGLASNKPAAGEQATKQKLKIILENDELLIAAFVDKVYRINADGDAEAMFREVTEVLDTVVSKNAS